LGGFFVGCCASVDLAQRPGSGSLWPFAMISTLCGTMPRPATAADGRQELVFAHGAVR
jgi:hypothetical protein